MLQPTDPRVLRTHACEAEPRDAALIDTAASVIGRLVVAHACADHPEIAAALADLLRAVAKHGTAHAERPGDAALVRAVAALGAA